MLQNLKRILMATAMLGHIPGVASRMAAMPPVKQYRRGMERDVIDLRYTEQSFRKPSKRYPFQSAQQISRFRANYASEGGVIRPLTKAERRY